MTARLVCAHPSYFWTSKITVTCRRCGKDVFYVSRGIETFDRKDFANGIRARAMACHACNVRIRDARVTAGDVYARCSTCYTRFHPPKLRIP